MIGVSLPILARDVADLLRHMEEAAAIADGMNNDRKG